MLSRVGLSMARACFGRREVRMVAQGLRKEGDFEGRFLNDHR